MSHLLLIVFQNLVLLIVPIILVIDIICTLKKMKRMDQLMSLVKRGELSYIQFVNKMDDLMGL